MGKAEIKRYYLRSLKIVRQSSYFKEHSEKIFRSHMVNTFIGAE